VTKWMLAILAAATMTAGCGSSASETTEGGATDAATAEGGVNGAAAAVGIPTYREVTLPAGTTLPLELKTAVASDTSNVEDSVRASLRR
jgi:hypothetical protein